MSTRNTRKWFNGAPAVAPAAGAALVSLGPVTGGGYNVYGYRITAEEAVVKGFELRDGATVIAQIWLGAGEHHVEFESEDILHGTGAGNTCSINTINAGAAGMDYQASILVD